MKPSTALGQITAGPADDPAAVWEEVRALAAAGGLPPLAAARLALAAVRDHAARAPDYRTELDQLRAELDATSQGLLALHAELSDQRDQLEQAHAAAERASQAKAAFLASMSHEIRSPLNAVIGFTSLLQETGLTPEQAECAETLAAAGNHLKDLVNGILDLSKVESGELELEDLPFDLIACAEDAAAIAAPQAEDKHLALAVLVDPGVPATVTGDPLRLRQILVNLLVNAVKFTHQGQVTIEVSIRPAISEAERNLVFAVHDTGPGIPAHALDRLFDPFTQADASITRHFGGTGLGLAISKQLTERMGGKITASSTRGQGATFTATFPLRQLQPATASHEPDLPLAGAHVLLVHPQPAVAEAARRHLAAWGAAVTVAASAADAASRSTEWADAALAVAGTSQPADLPGAIETLTAAHSRQRLPIVALIPLSWQPAAPPLAFAWTVTATPIRRARLREAILAALGHDRPSAHHPAPGAPAPGSARALRVLVAEDDPVNQRATAPSARPAHATPSARSQSGLQPATARTVLYIEDDPALRALVQRILARDATVTVLTAADGTTGLQLADTQRPDLILLDWNVPGTSGETLINNLRTGEHTSTIPIVVVSGDTSPATVKHLTGLGAAAHLAKPFDAEHLKAIITAPATRRV